MVWRAMSVAVSCLLTLGSVGCSANPLAFLFGKDRVPAASGQVCPLPSGIDEDSFFQADLRPEFRDDAQRNPSLTHYTMAMQLDTQYPPTVTGKQTVQYTNTQSDTLDRVVFRLYPNLPYFGGTIEVNETSVDGSPVQPRMFLDGSALEVPLASPLPPGKGVRVDINFDVEVPTDNTAGYGQFAFMNEVFSLPNLYPTIPVYDPNGWNAVVSPYYGDVTVTDAALYRVCLTAPADLNLASSGVVVSQVDSGDGTRTWTLEAGPKRDFAIFLSRDLWVVERDVWGTTVRSFHLRGDEDGGMRALQYAADAFEVYSRLFGDYPYKELDVVATPNNAGGIEYPGVVAINQAIYSLPQLEGVIAHEVAHQWWYGLVGSDQVDEPWLDEALANYSMYLYFEDAHGTDVAAMVKRQMFDGPYHQAVLAGGDRGAGGRVADFRSADEYYAFVYSKGPLFFDAVRRHMGREAFLDALRTYLSDHEYGRATSEDLLRALEDKGGPEVVSLYNSWILGKNED